MTNQKKYVLIVIFVILSISHVMAQEINVTDFYLDEGDLTANREAVEDQNGDKCALIRVQTTQKGFLFDVGSAGITKIDDSHTGEIWLWVPYGIKHISIRHEKLGSLPKYDFPISIKQARTYVMKITHEQIFVTNYDDTKKQKLSIKVSPSNARLSLNGMNVALNHNGEATMEMAHGKFAYKVEADRFYPEEGLVTVDDTHKTLIINNLKPITGKLSVHVDPMSATVSVDGESIGRSSLEPIELQIGNHEVDVFANGYKSETKTVTIYENQTADIEIQLTRTAMFHFSSTPNGAAITINNSTCGSTPMYKELTTGTYTVKAEKTGYKDFEQQMQLNSSNPEVHISLKKIYNYKDEYYLEGNLRAGAMTAVGGTVGCYFRNVNLEVAYLRGLDKSEDIYWCNDVDLPRKSNYTSSINIAAKVGYGIPIATRLRFTPQAGIIFAKLSEDIESGESVAKSANVASIIGSVRFSMAFTEHIAISVSPEYQLSITKSTSYASLSDVSPKIKQWSNGFNVKLGIVLFY